jgi:hypothetical protein
MSQSQESSDISDSDDDHDDEEDVQAARQKFQERMDWTKHAQALCSTLIVPMNATKIDYPLLPAIDEEIGNGGNIKKISQFCTSSARSSAKIYSFGNPTVHYGTSPYPYLDKFILDNLANRGGIQGTIRAYTLNYSPPMENGKANAVPIGISFQMLRNRWCECVGRHHKSNNIMWNVDFQRKQCIQACYDPECRAMNFRGTPIDLPFDVAMQLDDALFDEQIAQMDESELIGKKADGEDSLLERALNGLNLEDTKFQAKLEVTTPKNDGAATEPNFEDLLSDDALAAAISSNPEHFH